MDVVSYPHPYRKIRDEAGVHPNTPVVILKDGDGKHKPPTKRGQGWHYRTKGGTRIQHPSAYKMVGWTNAVYHHSTLRVEVGVEWLAKHCKEALAFIFTEKLKGVHPHDPVSTDSAA